MKRTFIRPLGTFPQTPAPVQNLVATVISSTEIDLSWTPISGASAYTVRRDGNPINTGAVSTFNNTGLTASTTYSYTVAAINTFGEGLPSAKVTATTSAAVSPSRGFNPGHGFSLFNYNDTIANHLSYISALNNPASNNYDPNHYIKHIMLYARWNVLENTQGDYLFGGDPTKGKGMVDQYVNACAAVGRFFILSPMYQAFSNTIPQSNAHFCLPAYLDGIASGPYVNTTTTAWSGTLVVQPQLDTTAGMDRFIALTQAYAGFYDANPNFEMYSCGESSVGVPGGFNGFNQAGYDSQFTNRWMPAARTAWAHTQVRNEMNFTNSGGSAAMPTMFISALANKITSGGPDVFSTGYDSGVDWGLGTRIGNFGAVDYRASMLHTSEQQERHINQGGYTPSIAYNNTLGGQTVSQSHYWIWERQNYGTVMQWTRDIFPFIQSIAGAVNTVRPAGY